MSTAAGLLTLALLAAGPADPRIELIEAQIAGDDVMALTRVEAILATQPGPAKQMGLDYLRGHLLEGQGKAQESTSAFLTAITSAPQLAQHGYYRLALEYESLGHPEMAAGLVAKVVNSGRDFSRLGEAARFLRQTLNAGGDCRLLSTTSNDLLPDAARREVRLARAECAVRKGEGAVARAAILALLNDTRSDEVAYQAAELAMAGLGAERNAELALAVGLTLHEHREFAASNRYLDLVIQRQGRASSSGAPLGAAAWSLRYARQRNDFWLERYAAAAAGFEHLAGLTNQAEQRGDAFYQQGRSLELAGDWTGASAAFRRGYSADPHSSWAGANLISALRLEWRSGLEEPALELYERLLANRRGKSHAARAAVFLASSELVRGQSRRAGGWLDQAERLGAPGVEVAYWRGRLAELQGAPAQAVDAYLGALLRDSYHPFGRLAAARLAAPALVPHAQSLGVRLSASTTARDQTAAWLLLGPDHPRGQRSRRVLLGFFVRTSQGRELLNIAEVPPAQWPLWSRVSSQPEDLLLAMGLWGEAARAVGRHFPATEPSLAYTAARNLARAGEVRAAVRIAEILDRSRPGEMSSSLLPVTFRRLLYPFPYRESMLGSAAQHGVEPALLAAIIREESRFDPQALSGASARGLTQFTQPTAQRFAAAIGQREVGSEDLYRPAVAIALGSAYLGELGRQFKDLDPAVVAAYNAGEHQARVWSSHCFSPEPAEYLSKVGFRQTRAYVARVLTSRAQYRGIYGEEIAISPRSESSR